MKQVYSYIYFLISIAYLFSDQSCDLLIFLSWYWKPGKNVLEAVIRVLERIGYDVITGPDADEFDMIFVRYDMFDLNSEYNTTKKMTPRHLVIVTENVTY